MTAPTPPSGPPSLGEPDDLAGVRAERDAASARCRELEHELGRERGRVKRLETAMYRRTARRQRAATYVRRLRAVLPGRSDRG
ncbi:MAG: hypothetical protein M3337_00485 [Actinomycetota bacterium]|nr:hypothetical protein [Actinomycetota bacterium]